MKKKQTEENLTTQELPWSPQELEGWVSASLIPEEFLESTKYQNLFGFLKLNHQILREVYAEDAGNGHYRVNFARPNMESAEYELQLIDTRTSLVIKTLENTTEFELVKGINIHINANELDDWKHETAEVHKLTKEQKDNLLAFISKFGSERMLTKNEIVTFIKEIRKPKKVPKYRQSGHFVDEKLKYPVPREYQLTLFDLISPATKQKIEESKLEVTAEGIKLTTAEHKLVHALNKILYEKSQNKNTKSEAFYAGNLPSELMPYGGNGLQARSAVLKFKPSELYKAYLGHDDYSGHDINFINATLHQLESKRFLIKYDRVKKVTINKKQETRTDRLEDFQSLIKIVSFIPDLTDEEKHKLDRGGSSVRQTKGELIVALNPIFTDQIDTKFVEFPADFNRRLVIAAGGHNKVTASMQTLMEWMLREISNKRYKTELNHDKLPLVLGLEKYVKQNRKKLLQERIEKDINAIVNMGIIQSYEVTGNSTGGLKWVFHLNKDYE